MNRKRHKYSSKLYLVGNHLSPWKVNHKGCGVSFFLTLSEHITIVYCSPEPLYVFDFNFCVHVVYFMLAWHVCCVNCWFVWKLSVFCFCLLIRVIKLLSTKTKLLFSIEENKFNLTIVSYCTNKNGFYSEIYQCFSRFSSTGSFFCAII